MKTANIAINLGILKLANPGSAGTAALLGNALAQPSRVGYELGHAFSKTLGASPGVSKAVGVGVGALPVLAAANAGLGAKRRLDYWRMQNGLYPQPYY